MSGRYLTAARLRDLEADLHPADLALVRQVAVLRFVGAGQLVRLCAADAGERATRRRLLRLARLGLLDRLPRAIGGGQSGSAGFVYCLDLPGQRLAMHRGWIAERRLRRDHVPGRLFVRHHLAVAELHARLSEADRCGLVDVLELACEPACWRRYDTNGLVACTLKPDSFVRLGIGAYEWNHFIEVDRGTEGSAALTAQLERYVAYHRSGREERERGVFPKVLWLAPDAHRERAIRACIDRLEADRELFDAAVFDQAIEHLTDPEKNGEM